MRNAGLDEVQTGIKIAGRNTNNLTYTDDTTLMAESEELKSLLMKVKKESEKIRGMVWGGRREEGSGWGTHVYLWQIHFDIWQDGTWDFT